MIGGIFAQHQPLIRDYPSAPAPPPAPPAPPTPPQPPQAQPIAFSVITRDSLFGITGSATGTITLATVTCADGAMTISTSESVPGLTFSYAAKVLTISGTPTTPTGVHRVVVSYMSSDGAYTVRGSSTHEITIVAASEVLTIGSMASVSGQVGSYLGTPALCSPTSNFPVDVTAAVSGRVPHNPGVADSVLGEVGFSWVRGASSGSGVLSGVSFIPSQAGTYTLTVTYSGNGQVLGTSTHTFVIAPSYQAAAPAPAPVAGPAAPVYVAPPAPTPAPAPGLGPDPLYSSVNVLLHFDTATGLATDQKGNAFTNYGATSTDGAVAQAGLFTAGGLKAAITGSDGYSVSLTAECLVQIGQSCWDAHRLTVGAINRFSPALSLVTADANSQMVWTLGFFSTTGLRYSADDTRRVVMTALMQRINGGVRILPGRYLTDIPDRFVHLAMCQAQRGGFWYTGSWFDGLPGVNSYGPVVAQETIQSASGILQIGGAVAAPELGVYGGSDLDPVRFAGVIDEARITNADRYSTYVGATIPLASRVIPWPNY